MDMEAIRRRSEAMKNPALEAHVKEAGIAVTDSLNAAVRLRAHLAGIMGVLEEYTPTLSPEKMLAWHLRLIEQFDPNTCVAPSNKWPEAHGDEWLASPAKELTALLSKIAPLLDRGEMVPEAYRRDHEPRQLSAPEAS